MARINLGRTSRRLFAAASIVVLAFGTSTSTAAAGGIRNCVDVTGKNLGRVGCYETVWSDDVEYRMTFSNQAFPGATPRTLDRFYVLAPQGNTPQGNISYFPHDHVVRDIPGDGGNNTVKLAGFFVLCSEQGLTSGSCAPTWLNYGQAMPFAKTVDGSPLTSTTAIEAAADAGDVVLLDLGPTAVIVGSINRSK
jgi:hypothetical protein